MKRMIDSRSVVFQRVIVLSEDVQYMKLVCIVSLACETNFLSEYHGFCLISIEQMAPGCLHVMIQNLPRTSLMLLWSLVFDSENQRVVVPWGLFEGSLLNELVSKTMNADVQGDHLLMELQEDSN